MMRWMCSIGHARSGMFGRTCPGRGRRKSGTADVPVGGGVVLTEAKVVVTQPKAGEFKAFTAVCTHRQCTVSKVADGTIDCPCHGSQFSAADGSVVKGPAEQPLAPKAVTVAGDTLTVA